MNYGTIKTDIALFTVYPNSDNRCTLSYNDHELMVFPNTYWWDKDGILAEVEENRDSLLESINAVMSNDQMHIPAPKVTMDNAKEILMELKELLKDEEKGFYSSRLQQCINKLA